jgi:hypothetical protein
MPDRHSSYKFISHSEGEFALTRMGVHRRVEGDSRLRKRERKISEGGRQWRSASENSSLRQLDDAINGRASYPCIVIISISFRGRALSN